MTVEQWIISQLQNRGMSESHYIPVLEAYKSENQATMGGRWNDDIDEYSVAVKALVLRGVKRVALRFESGGEK